MTKKPTILDITKWEFEYYKLRNPKLTKEEYIKKQKAMYYRYNNGN